MEARTQRVGNIYHMEVDAKIESKGIYFFWSGKWRGVRYYQGNGIPSQKIQQEAIRTFLSNVGKLQDGLIPKVKLNWL